MAIDAYGRYVPDYSGYNDYRAQLQRQKEELEYRLSEFDRRYQPQHQQVQPPVQQVPQTPQNPVGVPAPLKQIIQPFIVVKSEHEAREYPIVKSLDDDIGKVHFFVLEDESMLFAKRINPGTFEPEFEIYDHRKDNKENTNTISNNDGSLLLNIDARLQKIEAFVDNALAMFMTSPAGTGGDVVNAVTSSTSNKSKKPNLAEQINNRIPSPVSETKENEV